MAGPSPTMVSATPSSNSTDRSLGRILAALAGDRLEETVQTLSEVTTVAAACAADSERDARFTQGSPPPGDGVVGELVRAIHAPGSGKERADQLFQVHVRRALAACAAGNKDGVFRQTGNKGGLAPCQLYRATEILEAHIGQRICVSTVARECGLTAKHFARAFRVSTGVAPSQWLIDRRIASAKTLLSTTSKSLSEVALDCGFAGQSHFTQVFGKRVGVSPARWRAAVAARSRRRAAASSEHRPIPAWCI